MILRGGPDRPDDERWRRDRHPLWSNSFSAILTSRAKSLPVLHEIMPLANGNCGKVKRLHKRDPDAISEPEWQTEALLGSPTSPPVRLKLEGHPNPKSGLSNDYRLLSGAESGDCCRDGRSSSGGYRRSEHWQIRPKTSPGPPLKSSAPLK